MANSAPEFMQVSDSNFVPAKGFFNLNIVLKDGSKVSIGGIADGSKISKSAKDLLTLLSSQDKAISLNVEVAYNSATSSKEVTLDDL